MAERDELQKRYAYHEMSNKVEQVDRSALRRNRGEPTGEVESLRGRGDVGRMGDRVAAKKPEMKAPPPKKQKLDDGKVYKKPIAVSGDTLLELGNLKGYQPITDQARAAYETILTLIGSRELLGSQAPQVLRDAAGEVISIAKDQNMRDPERHAALSKLLTGKKTNTPGSLGSQQFTSFIQLCKQLDDYDEVEKGKVENEQIDDEMGVAVVFDESEEDSVNNADSDVDQNVVVEPSSDDESDAERDSQSEALAEEEEEKVIQGQSEDLKKKGRHGLDRVLSVHEIDAHFLQRQLSRYFDDADSAAKLADEVLNIIDVRNGSDYRECENRLLVLLGFDLFETIKLVLRNRMRVWACVSLKRTHSEEQMSLIEKALCDDESGEGKRIWEELHSKGRAEDWSRERMKGIVDNIRNTGATQELADAVIPNEDVEISERTGLSGSSGADEPVELDLDALAFGEGAQTMIAKTCVLPESSWRATKKGYEEVHVPAVRSVISRDERLVEINDLPPWTHPAFKGMEKLNRVQSQMCDVALKTSENILLCAPTGAGKTNVACLTMMNVLGQHRKQVWDDDTIEGNFESDRCNYDLTAFKIVYVAPMKALVQEVVKNFSERLKDYGVSVRELSGDSSLTRQQIADTQLLVTTPEKWDIVTRQGEGRAFTQLVKLVIIDEIHLLHDDRGPVIESIVARVIRQVENMGEPIRLVGLSATLPNYADVAAFLRVKPDKGLFFFDHSYRPVPLQMQYIGITERNAFKRVQLQNDLCYEKVIDQRRQGYQVLIFVHSRAETGKTAKALRDLAIERDELSLFVRDGGATQEILREESASAKSVELKDVLSYGFAIHHAGMAREDRELVEDLFADRHIGVLCSTATLAWGVNLPAHAVIIRGTQIYDPAKGRWAELSPLDILQMLGRAGRPQFDSEGEGIIITQQSQLQYYLSLTNLQLPVESQLVKRLPDHLNAEIVLGTIQTIEEAIDWISYTFLYIRMLRNPSSYGVPDGNADDPALRRRRRDLAHTAATILEKSHLIRYDRKSGSIQATPLGRVASQFYISHSSMSVYIKHMRQNMTDIELLRLFSMSGEFAHISVRENEKLELTKLAGRVPIPIKESPNDPLAKINILLQAYVSRMKLDGFVLASDMAFVQQSAARIMRALFEIALRRNWSSLAKLCLDMSNMVSYRIWRSQSPLRQFKNVPEVVARKLERKSDIEWARYSDLTPSDIGELVGVPKMGRVLHRLVHQFPRLELSAQIQPITRSLLRVELTAVPAFQFDVNVHGYSQVFHMIIEDVNGDSILHHEIFSLKSKRAGEECTLVFFVPILDPLPPAYFLRVMSDRWLHSSSTLPISFSSMILPAKFPPSTELLDLQPLLPSALVEPALMRVFSGFKEFNPIQTQAFHELFKTNNSCLICAPSGSGKSVCATFAVLRMIASSPDGKCVYIAPTDEIADHMYATWIDLLGSILQKSSIARLTGETPSDLELLSACMVVVATVRQWDMVSRRWRQRKAVQMVSLYIFDDIHFLGGEEGPVLEIVISRARYVSSQLQQSKTNKIIRIVGMSVPLANARDVAEWMGVSTNSTFNFSPKARPFPLELYFTTFEQGDFSARLLAMAKPVYGTLERHLGSKNAIVYVPSRRQAQLTAIDIMTYSESQGSTLFPEMETDVDKDVIDGLQEPSLRQLVRFGLGYIHNGMIDADWNTIIDLYRRNLIKVLVCPTDVCWRVHCTGHLVIIMGTEYFDGREGRHVDYPVASLVHMIGRQDPQSSGKCVIMCHHSKKDYLKKLTNDPLPIESHLDSYLHDPLNSEIVTKTVGSMQDAIDYVTWTFLYRRLLKNPTYYGLQGTSSVHLSEHLSEMVEAVVGDLEESKCCSVSEEGAVLALNLGMIAAYYYVQYRTIELIASSVTPKTKIRGMLEILSASWEFSSIPIRFGEDKTMKMLARTLVHKIPDDSSFDSNTKALILLQCYFSRKQLPAELRSDQLFVVKESVNLVQAIVDVISSNGWLKPALATMELSQMLVQSMWNKDNVLKQVPHFTDEIITRCLAHSEPVESVFDILALDDEIRNQLLLLPSEKMADVAIFCNNYPSIEVSFQVQNAEDISSGDVVQIAVTLEREDGDEMDDDISKIGSVCAPLFPAEKKEGWWLVIGDLQTNTLYSLKRVNLRQKQNLVLEFLAPDEAGDYDLTLFCMSDSYLGCDQEYSVPLSVAAALVDEEDTDD